MLHWDFGVSLKMQKNRPVAEIIGEMFPTSAKIGVIALIIAVVIGIPLGSIAAYNRGNKLDSFLRIVTVKVVYASILGDFKHLLESVKAIKADADASNNYLVSAKMDDYIESYSKAIWMISQVSM